MERLKDKVAIVTGGALGIGKAAATRMAEEGAAVAIFDCKDTEGEALAVDLVERGLKAHYWHCDVGFEASVRSAIDSVKGHFGRIDVLVNNAGIAGANKPTHELTEEEWDEVQRVNVKGVFFCTKHVIPHLKTAGKGSIVNLSSIYGLVSAPDIPPLSCLQRRGAPDDQNRCVDLRPESDSGEFNSSRLHLDPAGGGASENQWR